MQSRTRVIGIGEEMQNLPQGPLCNKIGAIGVVTIVYRGILSPKAHVPNLLTGPFLKQPPWGGSQIRNCGSHGGDGGGVGSGAGGGGAGVVAGLSGEAGVGEMRMGPTGRSRGGGGGAGVVAGLSGEAGVLVTGAESLVVILRPTQTPNPNPYNSETP
ncbi:hypothetical protein BDZ94DRAFT_1241085 [Collybia nuda]|uniref:Uncharacterized protein n=1 Tax=Collybia nuda TaxID=64659 RepID=A0A9P6C9D0_9AGAR|nr:hypothetical protein BDZ94DRAFT_1241085 [Collybia nuda]